MVAKHWAHPRGGISCQENRLGRGRNQYEAPGEQLFTPSQPPFGGSDMYVFPWVHEHVRYEARKHASICSTRFDIHCRHS
jgi:hypothetical protein